MASNEKKSTPQLVFSPLAWMKLQYLCQACDTEVGGYGVAHDPKKPLYLDDFLVPKQECTQAFCDLDITHASELWEDFLDKGMIPTQYASVWIHTHPGNSPTPSTYDETTFDKFTGDWIVMAILARGGSTYARLRINEDYGKVETTLAVSVDWASWPKVFKDNNMEYVLGDWEAERLERVTKKIYTPVAVSHAGGRPYDWNGHKLAPVTRLEHGSGGSNGVAAGFRRQEADAVPAAGEKPAYPTDEDLLPEHYHDKKKEVEDAIVNKSNDDIDAWLLNHGFGDDEEDAAAREQSELDFLDQFPGAPLPECSSCGDFDPQYRCTREEHRQVKLCQRCQCPLCSLGVNDFSDLEGIYH